MAENMNELVDEEGKGKGKGKKPNKFATRIKKLANKKVLIGVGVMAAIAGAFILERHSKSKDDTDDDQKVLIDTNTDVPAIESSDSNQE